MGQEENTLVSSPPRGKALPCSPEQSERRGNSQLWEGEGVGIKNRAEWGNGEKSLLEARERRGGVGSFEVGAIENTSGRANTKPTMGARPASRETGRSFPWHSAGLSGTPGENPANATADFQLDGMWNTCFVEVSSCQDRGWGVGFASTALSPGDTDVYIHPGTCTMPFLPGPLFWLSPPMTHTPSPPSAGLGLDLTSWKACLDVGPPLRAPQYSAPLIWLLPNGFPRVICKTSTWGLPPPLGFENLEGRPMNRPYSPTMSTAPNS